MSGLSRCSLWVTLGLMLNVLLPLSSYAGLLLTEHQQGWHWYQKRPKPQQSVKHASTETKPMAKQQLDALKARVSELRAKAILQPTLDNVSAYIALQNTIMLGAAQFATVWQKALWQDPNLNYRLRHPTEQVAQTILREQAREKHQLLLQQATKTMGLLFFFSDTCPYCQAFAPTLVRLTKRYPFKVISVSLSGKGLPDYPNPLTEHGQAKALGVTQVPALFLLEPKREKVHLVSMGLHSEESLEARLFELIQAVTDEEVDDEAN